MVGGTEDDVEWRLGHPILFPNILANSSSGFQIRVPVDDTHTWHVYYTTRALPEGVKAPDEGPMLYDVPLAGLDERGHPTWSTLDNNSGQDMLVWYVQGPIADRSNEKLGTADKGILLYRKLLEENMEKVAEGIDPMNVFRDPARNVSIHTVSERDEGPIASYFYENVPAGRGNTGAAGKYNPLERRIRELAAAKG
jgi:5,5'-dehydrodivanillate O-demethylase